MKTTADDARRAINAQADEYGELVRWVRRERLIADVAAWCLLALSVLALGALAFWALSWGDNHAAL